LLRDSDTHWLVLTAHHLIIDGSSLAIFVREFVAYYSGDETAKAALPRPMQFREFCAAAATRRDAGDREGRGAYWQDLLGADLPDWAPPADAGPRSRLSYEADRHTVILEPGLRNALLRRGGAAKATLFQTLLCAYFMLLHRVSGQERILVGIDAANREGPGESGVIGCCNALVPIVMDFADVRTVGQLQARLRDQVLQALERRDYTLTMWARDRHVAPDFTRPFKVSASMNMQRFPAQLGGIVPRFDLEAESISQSPFGLALEVRDSDGAVRLDFVYNKQFLGAAAIARFAAYYLRLLEGMASDAGASILALPILSDAESRQLLSLSRAPEPPAPFVPLLHRFAAQVAATPSAPAAACAQRRLTYRELQDCADRIAYAIAGLRGPGTPVALLARRGCASLAAILGILKAGCVYLPLDPKAPDARLRGQIAQGEAGLLVHDQDHRDIAARVLGADMQGRAMLCLDALCALAPAADSGPEFPEITPDMPAYLLFTSGSTGIPKAALVSHRGMMNHLQAKIDTLDLQPADVVAQTASQSFDISVWQYLAPLLVGGRVHVFDDRITHDPRALFVETDVQGISVLQTVPSMLYPALEILFAPGQRRPVAALRWLISTGEALPADLCRRWIALYPRVPMLNAYGPTECSDDVTHHEVVWPPPAEVVRVPIGRPIPGAELYVLDNEGNLVPPGSPGELHVGGACVGLGYHYDAARTAAAFVPDPFSDRPGSRLYRTGDLVRYREDGDLDYLGRLDQQVKINGVRIEPGEIEEAIGRDPSVLQSYVTTRAREDGTSVLVAYVVLRPGKSVLEGTLKAVARNSLPQSLIPSAIIFLDSLPLTPSGKIDPAALPTPDLRPRKADAAPPSTPLEEILLRIWSDTIGRTGFGIHDDFFDLGGRSLDATRIKKNIEGHFDIRLPLSEIFREPTVAGIARFVDRLVQKNGAPIKQDAQI